MSKLAFAMHALPPGSRVTPSDLALQRHQVLIDQHAQCKRTFLQAPSPRLGKALAQIEASIKHSAADLKKKGIM